MGFFAELNTTKLLKEETGRRLAMITRVAVKLKEFAQGENVYLCISM